jgi:hypothetical protein
MSLIRKTIDIPNTIEATAHHEAGHAAMIYPFWYPIRESGITIDLSTPGIGNVASGRSDAFVKEERDFMRSRGHAALRAWQQRVGQEIIINIAGPMAEFRYLNGGRSPAGTLSSSSADVSGDIERVHYLIELQDPLAWPSQDPYEMSLYCGWTRKLLREPRTWRAIRELAARLIQSGFVSGEDAEALFAAHKVPRAKRI